MRGKDHVNSKNIRITMKNISLVRHVRDTGVKKEDQLVRYVGIGYQMRFNLQEVSPW